ncbi:cyclin N-terminal domain-containing protein 1-like [Asterias rubens]|uniref:cyclin N-terminal domain-containing protein 1-like n=1 Tax=Asterias rubens TaxID=7604 RepID=UPI0014556EA8|nr:cyclin N-terminal domain-containing protein 1-like [Asterias rubens]
MDNDSIFGTPPEPVFNLKGSCLSSELLEDLLYVQATHNEKTAQAATSADGAFKQGTIAEMIFLICERFNQPAESRYLALDIFDRFMSEYVRVHYKKIQSGDEDRQKKVKTWKTFMQKLKKQVKLFMVSCVQIASKMCSHYKILTCRKCSRFLLDSGLGCTSTTILKTELTVLKTLDYRVYGLSPLTYIETLLEIMGHNDETTSIKILHEISLKVMDLAYLRRNIVYEKLFQVATCESTGYQEDRERFALVEHDAMFFASAIIGAASYVIDKNSSDKVISHVGRITCTPVTDILQFATILVENIL